MDTITEQMVEANTLPITDETNVVFVQRPEDTGEAEEALALKEEVTSKKINSTEFPRVQDTNNFTH